MPGECLALYRHLLGCEPNGANCTDGAAGVSGLDSAAGPGSADSADLAGGTNAAGGATGQSGQTSKSGQPGGAGFWFRCCGAPLKWAGRSEELADLKEEMLKEWRAAGSPPVALACASCLDFFRSELPEIEVLPVWEILASSALPKEATTLGRSLYLHDPCAARGEEAARQSVRALLKALGQEFADLPMSGAEARCCGYGGLLSAANPGLGEKFARDIGSELAVEGRGGLGASEIRPNEIGPDKLLPDGTPAEAREEFLAWCVMCRDRLAAVGRPALHLLHLLFPGCGEAEGGKAGSGEANLGPEDALEAALRRPSPGFSDRQETRLAFRNNILQSLWKEEEVKESEAGEIVLRIPDDVAQRLEARKILRSDLKKILADEANTQFVNQATGRRLACARPRLVSFWVEYSRDADGAFTVHDAYCHRMEVPGVPGTPEPGSNRDRWNIAGPGEYR